MSNFLDPTVPPPDELDDPIKSWINQNNGAQSMFLLQLRSELDEAAKLHSWTPTVTFATPGDLSVAYSVRSGEYVRRGRFVTLFCILTCVPTFTTASGGLRVSGIPFAVNGTNLDYAATAGIGWQGVTKAGYTDMLALATATKTFITVTMSGSGKAIDFVNAADVPSGGSLVLRFTLQYRF